MELHFTSFVQMITVLPDDKSCRVYLEKQRWNGTPVCPHCGLVDAKHYQLKVKGEFKGMYKCKSCRERFTVLIGTMFENSPIPLQKWFIAAYIFSAHKKGISSYQLSRDIDVTQKTAWFMLHRLREAFDNTGIKEPVTGMVEVDETYVGGASENKHKNKRIKGGQSALDKPCVVGVLQRDGNVMTTVLPCVPYGAERTESIKQVVFDNVDASAILVTDSHNAYKSINTVYPSHVKIKIDKDSHVTDRHFHTNNIECFWSHLKRGIFGIYHQVSPEHLQAYGNEFGFRYNTRKVSDKTRFDMVLSQVTGAKIKYSELIGK